LFRLASGRFKRAEKEPKSNRPKEADGPSHRLLIIFNAKGH